MDVHSLIGSLESERAHRARRVERIGRILERSDDPVEALYEKEYNDGVRFGLDLALAELRRELGDSPQRCACGKELDASGEHGGGYGSFCG